ncbi:MAG: hypothetical protein ACRDJU_10850 [Actinomycetota bacterium]
MALTMALTLSALGQSATAGIGMRPTGAQGYLRQRDLVSAGRGVRAGRTAVTVGATAEPERPTHLDVASHTGYTKVVKVAISIPDDLFAEAEEMASRLGLNRSQLYVQAIRRLLGSQDDDPVTTKLDELAAELGSGSGAAVGRRLIEEGAWEW